MEAIQNTLYIQWNVLKGDIMVDVELTGKVRCPDCKRQFAVILTLNISVDKPGYSYNLDKCPYCGYKFG